MVDTKIRIILAAAGTLDVILLLVWWHCIRVIDRLRAELVITKAALASSLSIWKRK